MEDNNKVEDNDKADNNNMHDTNDKSISALRLDRNLGFSLRHHEHQPNDYDYLLF